jgi:seryl-tRNA synthetase
MLDLAFVRNNLALVEEKLAQRGMASKLDQFRGVDQKRRRLLTEVEALKKLAGERMRVAIDLAVNLGQRRGGLLKLKREHLTADASTLSRARPAPRF